jgi:hypothetical protein
MLTLQQFIYKYTTVQSLCKNYSSSKLSKHNLLYYKLQQIPTKINSSIFPVAFETNILIRNFFLIFFVFRSNLLKKDNIF